MRQLVMGAGNEADLISICPVDITNTRISYQTNPLALTMAADQATSRTILLYEKLAATPETLPDDWFVNTPNTNWRIVQENLALRRHVGDTANYAYLDGHIETLDATQIHEWVLTGRRFMEPGLGR